MVKIRRLCTVLAVGLPMGLWLCNPPAFAATIPGCVNPADSALNQYCETIPSATGGQTPSVGAPAVASTLTPKLVRRIEAARGLQRALLRLPAPASARHHASRPSRPLLPVRAAVTSVWSLSLGLILVLVALAMALTATAAARWRQRDRPTA
jgi:hypothetical protein